jgi:urease accessory protein
VVHLRGGLLAPRVLRRDPSSVHVMLVATTATLLGGDVVELEVEVGDGLRLDLGEVAGTVAYHGRGRAAVVSTRVRVGTGATLTWAGEPLVVCDGARVERRLVADVDEGGRLLVRDHVALGRSGERGGSLECHTELGYGGTPALVETLDLGDGSDRDAPAMLGGARVVDTVTALGWRPDAVAGTGERPWPPDGVSVYALAAPGAQARNLVHASHASAMPRVWGAWAATIAVRNAG